MSAFLKRNAASPMPSATSTEITKRTMEERRFFTTAFRRAIRTQIS
jgi:hypothetical protein